jgi:uncharacterized protein (DUF1800 family)
MFKLIVRAELRLHQLGCWLVTAASTLADGVQCRRRQPQPEGNRMMRSAGLLAGLIAGMLAGCGGSDGSSGSTTTAPSSLKTMTTPSAAFGSTTIPSGSSGSTTTPPAAAMSFADAARLLEQATFGPTPSEVTRVAALGFDGYIAEQIAKPATGYSGFTYVPQIAAASCQRASGGTAIICARDNYSSFQVQRQFFENALTGPDQLRQRVAFALSQLFVVSDEKIHEAYGMAAYQNLLLNDAFQNFRRLMEDVTLSPVMGHYLDMVKNAKANPAAGTSPNQNYARELLQLFSIGVNKLNPDGSLALDVNNHPQPTYDQNVIEGFSEIFTGWTFAPLPGAQSVWNNTTNYQGTMVSFPTHHEPGTKLLLNGAVVPAGQTPEADLKLALDAVFNHPNVGPFIGKQLIQHLVTSNPSPAYVARVASVFANNGQGVRGDLAAVVKAILGDVEARGDSPSQPSAGHLREPALFITSLMRGLGARSDGVFLRGAISAMGQPVFAAPTVFNFYPPSYELPGTGTLGPEFFIQNAATGLARSNFVNQLVFRNGAPADPTVTGSFGTMVDLSSFVGATPTPTGTLVTRLNTQLMHGSLSSAAQGIIVSAINVIPASDALGQVKAAAYLITTSQQFQVER